MPVEWYISIVIVVGIPLILIVVGIVNAVNNLNYAASKKAALNTAADRRNTLIRATQRTERFDALPVLPKPGVFFSLMHDRIPSSEFQNVDFDDIFDYFEKLIIQIAPDNIFFAKTASEYDQGAINSSMMIGLQATSSVCFLAWITLEERRLVSEWNLMAAETRPFGNPGQEESHFMYGEHQHTKYKTGDSGVDSLTKLWDLGFGNHTMQPVAKKAEWFQRFIIESWAETLQALSSGLIHQNQISKSDEIPSQQWQTDIEGIHKPRPMRRD